MCCVLYFSLVINFPNIFNQAGRPFYTPDVGRSGSYGRNQHGLRLLNSQRSYLYRPNNAAEVASVQTFADNIFSPSTNRFIRAHHINRQPHSHRYFFQIATRIAMSIRIIIITLKSSFLWSILLCVQRKKLSYIIFFCNYEEKEILK